MNSSAPRRPAAALLVPAAADLAAVLLFAATGRRTHDHGIDIAGIWETAAPFLAGAALAWFAVRAWRRPAAPWPTGVVVWLGTVILGLALRGLAGGGLAPSFQLVTLLALGVLLLGWRLAARLVTKIRNRPRVA